MHREHAPVWYPSDHIITLKNLTDFIELYTGLRPRRNNHAHQKHDVMETEEEGWNEWEEMGWRLWQYAEKERQVLEADNRQLAEEIKQLKRLVEQTEGGSPGRDSNGEGDAITELETMLLKLLGSKDEKLSSPGVSTSGGRDSTHTLLSTPPVAKTEDEIEEAEDSGIEKKEDSLSSSICSSLHDDDCLSRT